MEQQKTCLAKATAAMQSEADQTSFDMAQWLATERYQAEKQAMKYYIPPQWSPAEMHERNRKAIGYSKLVRQLRRGQSRYLTKFTQRVFTVAVTFFAVTLAVTFLVGAA